MDAPSLQLMMETGRKLADVIIKPPAEPDHVYLIRKPDGTTERHEAVGHPVKRLIYDLETVNQIVSDAAGDALNDGVTPEVWYSLTAIQVLSGPELRNSAKLLLIKSEPLDTLIGWSKTPSPLTQKDIVRTLRVTFRGCLGRHPNLVTVLSKVDFKATATINGEVGHGKASLGKQLAGEVTGAGAIPEFITLQVPMFINPSFRDIAVGIECALDPDPQSGMFRIIPVPGEIENAIVAATAEIRARLLALEPVADQARLYHGSPA
jgi:hypothetical protein